MLRFSSNFIGRSEQWGHLWYYIIESLIFGRSMVGILPLHEDVQSLPNVVKCPSNKYLG